MSIRELLDILPTLGEIAQERRDEKWMHTLFTIQAIENTRAKNPKALDHRWKKYIEKRKVKSQLKDTPENIRLRIKEAHERGLEREKAMRRANDN